MDKIQGKHFSITDPQGVNTVIYRVNKTPRELLQEYPKFTVQRLEYAEELNGNLKRKHFCWWTRKWGRISNFIFWTR